MRGLFDSAVKLRHPLACAADLWRECIVNRRTQAAVAGPMGLDLETVQGAVRLLRAVGRVPSPERLALIVQKDQGLDDNDIAEMFGRTARWSRAVRDHADELKYEEHIPDDLEWLSDDLTPDMPSPAEILSIAESIRMRWSPDRTAPRMVDYARGKL